MAKLTQRQLADNYAKQIAEHMLEITDEGGRPVAVEGIERLEPLLDSVLGAAQNPPPEGSSDGTLSEAHWAILANVSRKAMELRHACEDWKRFTDALKREEATAKRRSKT